MKFKKNVTLVWICLVFVLSTTVFGGENKAPISPAAHIPEPFYEFDSVVEGVKVTHEYVIQNTGTALLEIQKIKTG